MGFYFVGALEPNKDARIVDGEKSIILLGVGFTTPNMGVWALASGAIASALHSFPDAKIYLLDYNKDPARYEVKHPYGITDVDLVNIRFSKKLFLQNNIMRLILTAFILRCVPSQRLRDRVFKQNPYLKVINQADIIGSIAGGDSFSDIYGFSRLLYVSLPQILILLMGKSLILMPQTLGPFKGTLAKAIACFIIRRAHKVYSRDNEGILATHTLLGEDNGKIHFSYDMGFALEPQIADDRIPSWLAGIDRSVSLVGLNVSGLLYMGGYTMANMFGLKADYRKLVHGIVRHFALKHGANVMLIPHVFGEGDGSESDVTACRDIYQTTEDKLHARLHLIEEGYNHHEIKALIGLCDFFLGSRMHACIAALSQCIPAVGLAYSKKFFGVYQSIAMKDLVIDLRLKDHNSIIEAVDKIYMHRLEFNKQLKDRMQTVRASVFGLFACEPGPLEICSRGMLRVK
jgi:colanic acid/amylovoran biosynthesis protein